MSMLHEPFPGSASPHDASGDARFRATFEHAPVGLAHVALDGRWLHINDRLCEIVGHSRAALATRTFQDITHPDDLANDLAHVARLLGGEIDRYTLEKRYVRADGGVTPAQLTVSLVRTPDGAPDYFVSVVEDLTARRAAEEARRASERTLRSFYESSPFLMGLVELTPDDSDILHVYDNPATDRFFGAPVGSTAGSWSRALGVPEAVRIEWIARYREAERTGAPVRFESAHATPGGEVRLSVTVAHVGPGDAGRARFSYVAEDVTQQRAAEARLRESEGRFRQIFEHAATGISITDAQGRFLECNPAYARLLGYPPDALRRMDFPSLVHPDDRAANLDGVRRVLAGELQALEIENRYVHRDGHPVWVHKYIVTLPDAGGGPARLLALVTDVSARRRAEQALAESEAQLRTLVDSIDQLAWIGDGAGRVTWYNQRWYDYTGLTPQQMASVDWAHVHGGDDAVAQLTAAWEAGVAGGRPFELEVPMRGADGRFRWFLTRVRPVHDAEGRLTRWIGTNTDVSAQREAAAEREALIAAERAARERTERLQALAAELSAARTPEAVARLTLEAGARALGLRQGSVYALDGEGRLGDMLTLVEALGYDAVTRAAWARQPVTSGTLSGDAILRAEPVVLGRRAELAERYPALRPLLEGTSYCGGAVFPLLDRHGRATDAPPAVVGFGGFDFHEERELAEPDVRFLATLAQLCAQALARARLDAAERAARAEAERANAAKSSFLATMSHELRTPLNAIAGHADLIALGIHGPVTDAQAEALERIRRSQQHLLALIDEVLSFARIETGRTEYRLAAVPLDALYEDVASIALPLAQRQGVTFERMEPPHGVSVRADPDRLRQILVNLLGNAVKFTPPGGRVTLAASVDATVVRVRVSDTGPGIALDAQEAIFEPFVQLGRALNNPVEGTGLGLAISREHARAMLGDLTVASLPGEGATFTVTLPRAHPDA